MTWSWINTLLMATLNVSLAVSAFSDGNFIAACISSGGAGACLGVGIGVAIVSGR